MGKGKCDDNNSLLRCKFHFPDGTYPLSEIAMVTDKEQMIMTLLSAETFEQKSKNTLNWQVVR